MLPTLLLPSPALCGRIFGAGRHGSGRTGSGRLGDHGSAFLVAGILATACSGGSGSHDAVFLGTRVQEVPSERCDDGPGRCVAVTGPVDGTAVGEGSCRLYGPGDPDRLTPLAESGPLELVPGETVEWTVTLPGAVDVRSLNPVCEPMIEG